MLRVLGDGDGGAGAGAVELADSDALVGVVHGDLSVVGAGEEQVTVLVVNDLADGT